MNIIPSTSPSSHHSYTTACDIPAIRLGQSLNLPLSGLKQAAISQQLAKTMSREAARISPCPRCSAEPGKPCFSIRGRLRKSNHIERVMNAAKWI